MIDYETVRFAYDPTDIFEYGTYTRGVRARERADRTFYERCSRWPWLQTPPGTDTYWGDR